MTITGLDPYAFMVPFYDHWSAHMTEDIEFYVRRAAAAAGKGPVVELGAGSGRVTIPMAAAGADVVAVDVSDAMLTASARRAAEAGIADRISYVSADMRAFVADPAAPLVVIPFRSFQHLLTVDDQLAALDAIHRSLLPGGLLILNLFTQDPEKVVAFEGRPRLQTEYRDEFGRRCEVWATSHARIGDQLLDVVAEQRVFEGDRVVASAETTLHLRIVHRFEFEHLLARAGFEVEALYGGFDERPYGPGPDEMVWVARKRL